MLNIRRRKNDAENKKESYKIKQKRSIGNRKKEIEKSILLNLADDRVKKKKNTNQY